jgi:hypothetical protein
VVINYVSIMQYPQYSLFNMTNGPITKTNFLNNNDDESYMSQEILTQEKLVYVYF